MTLKQAMDALEAKELSSVELTQSLLNRIEDKEPQVKALITVCSDSALSEAKDSDERRAKGEELSPYDGIPAIIKDNICTKGIKTTCASKMLENFVPPYDAHVVEQFKDNGIITLAKANLDEFAMGSSTENSAFKTTSNPWNLSRVPGGSSGGSAAAVSARFAPLALGSDTGGSIRQPSSYCGVVGVKPTYGAVSRYGLVAFASSLDQIGPFTRSVEDAAVSLNVLYGHDKRDTTSIDTTYPDFTEGLKDGVSGMKIGLPKEYFHNNLNKEVKASLEETVKAFESMGAIVEETSLPTFDYALTSYYIISSAEATSNLSRYDGVKYGFRAKEYSDIKDLYIKTRSEGFGDEVKRRMMLGNYVLSSGYYDAYYMKALKVRTLIKQDFDKLFSRYDLILSPTAPSPAFELGDKSDPMEMYLTDIYTVPVNTAGLTAISVPCAMSSKKMPIGMQLIAKPLGEKTMLRAAYALEKASPKMDEPSFAGGDR